MQINEYQSLAQRTSSTKGSIDKLMNGALGLTGESGEVADIVKKFMYQGHSINYTKLVEELGDVCWYIAEICEAVGVSMEDVMAKNIEKLRRRYPEGFDSDRSVNRPEYAERKESGLTEDE